MSLYDPALLERPRLVAANKMDEPAAEKNLKTFKRKVPKTPVLQMAAAFDVGLDAFRKVIREIVEAQEELAKPKGEAPASAPEDLDAVTPNHGRTPEPGS